MLQSADLFAPRHIGPTPAEIASMLATLGYPSLDALIDATVPERIRFRGTLGLPAARTGKLAWAIPLCSSRHATRTLALFRVTARRHA